MSVNSFEDYPLSWRPERERLKPPIYLSLVHCLEEDIQRGVLRGGTKMPPQRELADYLDVSLNTITRVYTLCIKKGLLHAAVGRGTYVSEAVHGARALIMSDPPSSGAVSMNIATPAPMDTSGVSDILKRVLDSPELSSFFQYTSPLGTKKQRMSGVRWLEQFGIRTTEERVLIANGTQNALALVLTSLFNDGDKIAVDQYTYSNFVGLANMLKIALIPVISDKEGMSAAELRKLLRTTAVKGIYLSPSCSNPQAICMPEKRRRQLADIIKEYNIILIEDDCYAFLREEQLTPVSLYAPEQAIYLSGMNKALAPGLRIAFVWHPLKFKEALEAAVYNCDLIVSPLNAAFASEMIESGLYLKNIREQRRQTLKRNSIYEKYFPLTNPYSYYQWLPLPEGVSGSFFEALAAKEGIRVYGSERFLVGESEGIHYMRVSTTAAETEEQLEWALQKIQRLLSDPRVSKAVDNYTL